jgi:signal peptidase I
MKALKLTAYGLVTALACVAVGVGVLGWHHGYRAYAVQTGSMAPTYPTGALVIDRPVDGSTPRVGEVITFRTTQGLVTHRVHGLTSEGIQTKGDANKTPDAWSTQPQHVVGVVTWGAAYLGYVLVFFQQPTGVLSLMLLCFSVWCAWSAFFPAREATGKHAPTSPRDEPVGPSDEEATAATWLPEDPAAAAEGGVIRLPESNVAAAEGIGRPAA